MSVISELVKGGVDVVKEYAPQLIKKAYEGGPLHKEGQAIKNYFQRVADTWVNQSDDSASQLSPKGSKLSLWEIMQKEGDKLGKEMILGLIPFGPEIRKEGEDK